MAKHIAVIGGGMAGLAAAATLASEGEQVTLFEANQTLGGRARGIQYKDLTLDNGQHILLGAYHETLRLMALAGVDTAKAFHRLPLTLTIKDLSSANLFELNAFSKLPAPLHILMGLLAAKGVPWTDKLRAVQLLTWIRWRQFQLTQDEPLLTLLLRKKQSKKFIQQLWEPLCLSALNTPIEFASAQIFLNVLRDSFSKKKHDADLLLPTQDLTKLLSDPLASLISQYGGKIQCGTYIHVISSSCEGYVLSYADQSAYFSHVIIACGPHQLKNLTASAPQILISTDHFRYQPITTVYLQYPHTVKLPKAMTGSINSIGQWFFDRGQLCGQDGLIAVVISAHQALSQSQSVLANIVANELSHYYPQIGEPIWHKVITEKRATFSCDAHLSRPSNKTIYNNLLLAGDFTAGDYPATIEGAIRSGISASNIILST